ncbi:capsular polysaccharide biosynthesis protein Cps4B [Streptococcus merionis]|uniref:Tyrosine-protein phosphatase n=1 Tax=Streptococcus merionis TaxID=400065 RepID=A0A239SUH5_9STRE|nr:capsular polysaccharide biosynthesis protein Cps4B [Streptococcus merionis]SNU88293.1 protein-tyrosine-phosphatase [Streptococcus merionis]
MIDIHSHIIFGVDDGPKTLEESLELLNFAYDQGIRTIVATSHRRKGMFETPENVIWEHFQILKAEVAEILPDLTLLYGGELYYTEDLLSKLEQKEVPTMAGTRFALIEFSSRTPWKEIHTALSNVLLLGITPIVAHIERYQALEYEADRVDDLIKMGCYTQVNSLSLLKPKFFGDDAKLFKKRAKYFLENKLVHIIASDMHNTGVRRPYMKEAYAQIVKDYGQYYADNLFHHNAQTLLENKYL